MREKLNRILFLFSFYVSRIRDDSDGELKTAGREIDEERERERGEKEKKAMYTCFILEREILLNEKQKAIHTRSLEGVSEIKKCF